MPFIKKFATFKKKKGESSGADPLNRKSEPTLSALSPEEYKAQKKAMVSDNLEERMTLAGSSETHKEILYYLAEKDPSPKVREAVAGNDAMPLHASGVLAQDRDEDVRMALARRLMGLLPDLSKDEHSQLYAFAVQALGTLALDEVLKIRIALSATLKDHAHTPPKIASQLARDVEREVSEPILRFCAALPDEDLLDILRGHPEDWAVEAIAGRKNVPEQISAAVIETHSRPGGVALINNNGAAISELVLEHIVARSREFTEWQKPLASRAQLPVSIAKKLAEFVDASVRDLLLEGGSFTEGETEEIAAVFRRRVDFVSEEETRDEDIAERIERLENAGRLNEQTLSDALAMREREFVVAGLARLVKTSPETVQSIVDARAPKSIVVLCWKADLSMRFALELQKSLCNIHHKNLIYPKDGSDYPLSEGEILWQLEFLGL